MKASERTQQSYCRLQGGDLAALQAEGICFPNYNQANLKGYLHKDMELFYIIDRHLPVFEYHYHDFYKLLIHLQGEVTYLVEGKEYALLPGDTLFINPGEIHKPLLNSPTTYERMIAYISDLFFETMCSFDTDLRKGFRIARENSSHVVRLPLQNDLSAIVHTLRSCFSNAEYGNELLKRVKLEEYLIMLGRYISSDKASFIESSAINERVLCIMDFINQHIDEDLTMEHIASALFMHPSWMMHLFKRETGYTIGKYISEKRLYLANQYIQKGKPLTEVCYLAGFKSYGAFYYAYKKRYGASPKSAQAADDYSQKSM